jgi:hypothetical protein
MNKLQRLIKSWQHGCYWCGAFGELGGSAVWVSCVTFVMVLCVCGSGVYVIISIMTMVYELLKHSYIMGCVGIMCQLGEIFYDCPR